ncbi:MAG: DUF2834 domain-containing protein [Pseudomonadota bacterium]
MSDSLYRTLLWLLALGFAAAFCIIALPAALQETNPLRFVTDAYVNPYAAGYATDTLMCWAVLAVWVCYEAKTTNIRHGWVALLLGVVPGVATGFAAYLLIRSKQQPSGG